jgi:hypothetical protein
MRHHSNAHFAASVTLGRVLSGGANDKTVHPVKFAIGSTRLGEHWHPERKGSYYPRFSSFVRTAIAAAPQPSRLEGFFWLQGESDSGAENTATSYYDNLISLVQAVRCDLERPDLPFVASQIIWSSGKKVALVNKSLDRLNDEECTLEP